MCLCVYVVYPIGTPKNYFGLWEPEQHQPVHTGHHVSLQRHLLSGCFLLLLHRLGGEEQQTLLQDGKPEKSHLQHIRGLIMGSRQDRMCPKMAPGCERAVVVFSS